MSESRDPSPADDRSSAGRGSLERAATTAATVRRWPEVIDHIRQLARAGLPVPEALRHAAAGADRRDITPVLHRLADRVERGEPLSQAVRDCGLPLDDSLAALLEAGTELDDLWQVLSPLVHAAEAGRLLMLEYRRALVYFVLCLVTGSLSAVTVAMHVLPQLATIVGESATDPLFAVQLSPRWWQWVPLFVPVAVALVLAIDWLSRRGTGRLPLENIWPLSQVARDLRWFRLTATLQALLAGRSPLPQALRLAGRATLRKRVSFETDEMAAAIERGQSLPSVVAGSSWPLLLRSLLRALAEPGPRGVATSGAAASLSSASPPFASPSTPSPSSPSLSPGDPHSPEAAPAHDSAAAVASPRESRPASEVNLVEGLNLVSDFLLGRARLRMQSVRQSLQVLVTVFIGLGLLGYALLVFVPMSDLYFRAALPAISG